MARITIGYWMSDKKRQKLRFHEFEELGKEEGIEVIRLDLERDLETQGPFDAIVHKLVDVQWDCKEGPVGGPSTQKVLDYVSHHPETVLIDSVEANMLLTNRYSIYSLLDSPALADEASGDKIYVPNFVVLSTSDVSENAAALNRAGVTYPCVVKPLTAMGPVYAHEMMIVYGEHGLCDIKEACVAQSLVHHDGMLYKVFVIGDAHCVVERPSLKNLMPGNFPTDHFHSHDVSKSWSSSHLIGRVIEIGSPCIEPDGEILKTISSRVRQRTGLDLIGIDVIIDKYTGRYGVIDVNPFPGYEGVPDFLSTLLHHCVHRVEEVRKKYRGKEKGQRDKKQQELSGKGSLSPQQQAASCNPWVTRFSGQHASSSSSSSSQFCDSTLCEAESLSQTVTTHSSGPFGDTRCHKNGAAISPDVDSNFTSEGATCLPHIGD